MTRSKGPTTWGRSPPPTPTYGPENSGDGKVSTEWVLSFKGQVFTLYDYRGSSSVEEFRALPSYDWHIGGNDLAPVAAFKTAVEKALGR